MSGLDVGKKSVLLRFVEAMHFVDEHDRPRAGARFALGVAITSLISLMPASTALKETNSELVSRAISPRQRSLPATGRSPKQHRTQIIIFNLHAQRFAGPQQFLLPDEFIQRPRTHALRQRLMRQRHIRLDGLAAISKKDSRFLLGPGSKRFPLPRRFIKQHGGRGGRIQRFNAAGHRDANARVGAAFDFFRQARAFVPDEQRHRLAPIHFPRREHGVIRIGAASRYRRHAAACATEASVRTFATRSCVSKIGSDIPARIGKCSAAPAEARNAFGEKRTRRAALS